MLGIALIKLALGVLGFQRTLRLICARCARIVVDHGDHSALIAAADRTVALAAGFFPGRAACLEQSLALYYVLRRRGIAATFRVGVTAQPFLSHAWVEYRGHPVNDTAERVRWFTLLPLRLP
jgi:hypothetical protein